MQKNRLIISLILVVALLGLGSPGPALQPSWAQEAQPQAPAVLAPDTFANLAKQVSGAVVNISAEKIVKNQMREMLGQGAKRPKGGPAPEMPFGPEGPFRDFRDFFDKFFGEMPKSYKARSLGSGFIIDPKGYVVTNNHVVEGADKIKIILVGGKEYQATVKGRDPKTDLALIQIVKPPAELPFLKMGDSDAIQVGDWVLAVGNPFGLAHTVTQGIISAKGRVIGAGPYDNFLQTDASINPGNSGGPLLNINAELIGINTAIYQKAEGIGFAIPINRARRIYEDLIAYGEVHKPWMGIFLQDLTPQLAQYFGLDQTQGALISRVIKGSPGDHAGLKQGDIIARIGKETVKDRESCLSLTEAYKAGEVIPLTIIRKGNPQEVQVKSTEISPESALKISMEWTGLEVEEITSKGQGQDTGRGVIIIRVNKHSDAFRIGIREGDIIRQVNNTRISGMKDYKNAMKQALYAENVVLLVFRNNTGYYVTLTP